MHLLVKLGSLSSQVTEAFLPDHMPYQHSLYKHLVCLNAWHQQWHMHLFQNQPTPSSHSGCHVNLCRDI
nr:hypothetical protein Iba_chr14eCG11140 [Ipomoea batatas]